MSSVWKAGLNIFIEDFVGYTSISFKTLPEHTVTLAVRFRLSQSTYKEEIPHFYNLDKPCRTLK